MLSAGHQRLLLAISMTTMTWSPSSPRSYCARGSVTGPPSDRAAMLVRRMNHRAAIDSSGSSVRVPDGCRPESACRGFCRSILSFVLAVGTDIAPLLFRVLVLVTLAGADYRSRSTTRSFHFAKNGNWAEDRISTHRDPLSELDPAGAAGAPRDHRGRRACGINPT